MICTKIIFFYVCSLYRYDILHHVLIRLIINDCQNYLNLSNYLQVTINNYRSIKVHVDKKE